MNVEGASSFTTYRSRVVRKSADDVIRMLQFKESDTLLDVGCGSGELTKLVTANAKIKSTTAFDINPNMIDIAKYKNSADNITYLVGDAGDAMTFKPEWRNSFDKAMAYYSLHWIPNWPDTVRYMYECLKPGGECYLNIHAHSPRDKAFIIQGSVDELPKWQKYLQDFVYKLYTFQGNEEDFAEVLREGGFVDINVEMGTICDVFDNTSQSKDYIKCLLSQLECIPVDLKEMFLEEVFQKAEPKCEKTEDGKAKWQCVIITATAKKQ